jgi:DNA invertase Pin-like site-specific DNA recombinase
MSRLARSCKDWHQLLELCARFRALLADPDGVYDPTEYADRPVLGLTGMMSEAELHILKQRMYQGKLNKARRGESVIAVPSGYIKSPGGRVEFDPDEQVRGVIRLIFDEFDRQGTVHGVLRSLIADGVSLPVRRQTGPTAGSWSGGPRAGRRSATSSATRHTRAPTGTASGRPTRGGRRPGARGAAGAAAWRRRTAWSP